MFAFQAAGVASNMLTIGNALPLAAWLASQDVFEALWSVDPAQALMHGPTFMANSLAYAGRMPRSTCLRASRSPLRGKKSRAPWPSSRKVSGGTAIRLLGAIGVAELDRIGEIKALR
jgi:adenosylmethionine-8-amino-7-oxononanoate aminotransferase